MDLSHLLPTVNLAAGLLIFFMGFVILRENPRSPVNRATALMLFSGAVGSLLGALGQLVDPDASVDTAAAYAGALRTFSYLWEFFFPSLLYFALVFPVMHPFTRRMHLVETALYVPYVLHLLMVVVLSDVRQLTQPLELLLFRMEPGAFSSFMATTLEFLDIALALMNKIHQQLFSLVNLAYAGVAIGLLIHNRRRIAVLHLRGQLAVVLLGLSICVATYLVAMILATFFPFQEYVSLQVTLISIGLIVASIAIAYAIVRHKFLEMQNLARRSILYGGTALLFALLYLVIIRQVTRFSTGVFGANTEIIEAGFIVLAVIGFQPLLTAVEELIENLIRNRDAGDSRAIISNLSRDLAAEVDLPGMREKVESSLKASLLVQRVDLWTVERHADGGITLDSGATRQPVAPKSAFAVLLDSLTKAPQQILRSDLERSMRRFGAVDTDAVHRWSEPYALLVPLVKQDEVLGVLALGAKLTGGRFHGEDMALLNILSQQLATVIENVRLVSENVQKRILDEEINLATEIQEGLLPSRLPEHPIYDSHAVSFSSKFVGGDYYDLFEDEGRMHLAIADVSGKGVPAALLMSSLRAALHSNVAHLSSPGEVVGRINRLMYESTAPEKFATFFYGVLDTKSHELVYANAGHNYPIVVRSQKDPLRLTEGGLILGAFANANYEEGRMQMEPGDTLFLYTDGVTEATDENEEDYGEERLEEHLVREFERAPREMVEGVLEQVKTFTRGADPADDVTMLVIQRCRKSGGNGHIG